MQLFSLLFCGLAAAAEPTPWPKHDRPRVSVDEAGAIVVTGNDMPTTTTLLVLEKPNVPSHRYRFSGRIKYENVQGESYVEMLSRFADQREFFSRTLDTGGSMGKLTGSSDWRALEIPFFSEPDLLPERLTVNLVLRGTGKVWITPLTLEVIPAGFSGSGFCSLGGWLGAALGGVGGLIGILGGFVRTRKAALIICILLAVLSAVFLVLGGVFWYQSAAWDLWYGCLLTGIIGVVVAPSAGFEIKRRIAADELRRMQAMDVGG